MSFKVTPNIVAHNLPKATQNLAKPSQAIAKQAKKKVYDFSKDTSPESYTAYLRIQQEKEVLRLQNMKPFEKKIHQFKENVVKPISKATKWVGSKIYDLFDNQIGPPPPSGPSGDFNT